MSGLKFINLSANGIEGRFPDNVTNLTSLLRIDIDNNVMSGPCPTSLCDLPLLQNVCLHNNAFTGVALARKEYAEKLPFSHVVL